MGFLACCLQCHKISDSTYFCSFTSMIFWGDPVIMAIKCNGIYRGLSAGKLLFSILPLWTRSQWFKTSWFQDVSNGPLAHPLARSLAPLTRSLAPHCSLRSRAPLRSLVRSLAHSLAPELVGQWNIFVQFSRCPESLCIMRRKASIERKSAVAID